MKANIQFLESMVDMKDIKWRDMQASFQTPVYHAINTVFSAPKLGNSSEESLDLLTKTLRFMTTSEMKWYDLPTDTQDFLNSAIVAHGPKTTKDLVSLLTFQAEMGLTWSKMPQSMQQFIANGLVSAVKKQALEKSSYHEELVALLTQMNALRVDWKSIIGKCGLLQCFPLRSLLPYFFS